MSKVIHADGTVCPGDGCEQLKRELESLKPARQRHLENALAWALAYVRLPSDQDPEDWARNYNNARKVLKEDYTWD